VRCGRSRLCPPVKPGRGGRDGRTHVTVQQRTRRREHQSAQIPQAPNVREGRSPFVRSAGLWHSLAGNLAGYPGQALGIHHERERANSRSALTIHAVSNHPTPAAPRPGGTGNDRAALDGPRYAIEPSFSTRISVKIPTRPRQRSNVTVCRSVPAVRQYTSQPHRPVSYTGQPRRLLVRRGGLVPCR
jgi:hypothetical protein